MGDRTVGIGAYIDATYVEHTGLTREEWRAAHAVGTAPYVVLQARASTPDDMTAVVRVTTSPLYDVAALNAAGDEWHWIVVIAGPFATREAADRAAQLEPKTVKAVAVYAERLCAAFAAAGIPYAHAIL